MKLGYKLMTEEHGPADLVRNAKRAEQAGFDFAAISDHYFPWLEEQGHAPFAWSVLGAAAQATERLGLMTAVTCPIMRYHPAIIAQAAATMGLLTDGRFTLGLGAGERLNEHVVGQGWPGVVERHERLSEALDIIQGLLAGKLTTYRGQHFKLDHARLFDRPRRKPPVIVAAGGPEAGRLAGEKADGLIVTEPEKELIKAFTGAGGKGPRYAEVAMCAAADEDEARETAHRHYRWTLSGWAVLAELPHDEAFAAASKHVSVDMVGEEISCGPSADRHLEAIHELTAIGCDHIILTQIGPDQDFFFELFERKLAPALRAKKAA
ncbi:MAG: TIGR03557 family F420-dependent LLM class oxidoreductase [Rhodospirillales bacterium]|nr:TIGR03557 family F420-dependent LLM class oxidoreductase [Rhodospirillales bacterium]